MVVVTRNNRYLVIIIYLNKYKVIAIVDSNVIGIYIFPRIVNKLSLPYIIL